MPDIGQLLHTYWKGQSFGCAYCTQKWFRIEPDKQPV